ncbi:MAG TPA: MarR family transcriptional regulator [Ktedonobacteraceae bacterium]|nr:MarR family transcriptional regulator [Ktedonobacteraceae bacterium]
MDAVNNDVGVEQDVYHMLIKTFLLLDDCDRRFFAEYGLSTRQFLTLQHLDEQRGCSMVDLSRLLLTDKSNVTGIVDRLEHLHLVSRTPDPHDRRVMLIKLTAEGIHLRDTVKTQHDMRISELMRTLDSTNLRCLLDHLHLISRNIEAYLEQSNNTQKEQTR